MAQKEVESKQDCHFLAEDSMVHAERTLHFRYRHLLVGSQIDPILFLALLCLYLWKFVTDKFRIREFKKKSVVSCM
jgi:hypothetical protein